MSQKTPVQNPASPGHNPVQASGDSRFEINVSIKESDESPKEAENPIQETQYPKKSLDFREVGELKTESWKEEALPTQETKPAGKGPFEETGKAEGPAVDETRQITEGEAVQQELTEGKTVEESSSVEVETKNFASTTQPVHTKQQCSNRGAWASQATVPFIKHINKYVQISSIPYKRKN